MNADLISKLQSINEEEGTTFTATPKLYIDYINKSDEEYSELVYPKTIPMQYQLDIEYRSWGINGVNVHFPNKISVVYEKDTDNKERELHLDLNTARIDWMKGKFYGITDLNVTLNPDETVKEIVVEAVYCSPEA